MFNGYSLLLVLIIMIVVCLVARLNIGYEERERKKKTTFGGFLKSLKFRGFEKIPPNAVLSVRR